uniref:Uncharacterized protein n=1 Tax=Sphaerodactylus townsendi TaxID=933632 RepID=A0ACB8E9F1_9SAUR
MPSFKVSGPSRVTNSKQFLESRVCEGGRAPGDGVAFPTASRDLASDVSFQIETWCLEPEIARATASKTVVYNKGL